MKLLLTSAGIKNTSIHDALVDLLGKPIAECNALCIPTAPYGHPRRSRQAWRFISGQEPGSPMANWGGSPWACWSSPRCPASTRSAGYPGPGDRRPAGGGRRCPVSVPLDAAVRAGGPPAVAARDGLGGTERRKHGDDPADRGGLRRVEPSAGDDGTLGIVDFSIFPHLDHDGLPGNTMADAERWAAGIGGPGVRDRRRDRHQGGRRHRRGRLRGALETVHALELSPGASARSRQ